MTIYDRFRDLSAKLMTGTFEVKAKLYGVSGEYDARARTRSTHTTQIDCHAVLAPRRIDTGNGIIVNQLVATIDREPKSGDRLSVGQKTYTVDSVEEVAPDGQPNIWRAFLK